MDSIYIVGIIAGGVMTLTLFAVLALLLKKRGVTEAAEKYDERQRLARGTAFGAAFWVLVAYDLLSMVLTGCFEIRWGDEVGQPFVGVLIAATVFAMVCIAKDAYVSLRKSPREVIVMTSVIGGVNLLLGVMRIVEGEFLKDGLLGVYSINLCCAVALFAILAFYVANYFREKRAAGETGE